MKSVKFNKIKSDKIEEPKSLLVEKTVKKAIWTIKPLKEDFEGIKNKIWELRSEIKILVLNKKTLWQRIKEIVKSIRNEIKQIKNRNVKRELTTELKSVLQQYKTKTISEVKPEIKQIEPLKIQEIKEIKPEILDIKEIEPPKSKIAEVVKIKSWSNKKPNNVKSRKKEINELRRLKWKEKSVFSEFEKIAGLR